MAMDANAEWRVQVQGTNFRQTPPKKSLWQINVVTALVFVGLLFFLLLYLQAVHESRKHEIDQRLTEVANGHGRTIERLLTHSLSASYILGAEVRRRAGDVPDFDHFAAEIIATIGGITNVQLAPDGVVRQIYPLAGHEAAIGHDILRDDRRAAEAQLAIRDRQLTLAGPFELVQGGVAVIGRYPVFVGRTGSDRFWGFTSTLILLDDLIGATDLGSLKENGYRYELSFNNNYSGKRELISGNWLHAASDNFVSVDVAVPNHTWRLRVEPSQLAATYPIVLAALLALALSLAVAMALRQMLIHPRKLEALVARRTRELEQEREALVEQTARLDALFDCSPELVTFRGTDGAYLMTNRQAQKFFDKQESDLIGVRDVDLFPIEVAETLQQADRDVVGKGETRRTEFWMERADGNMVWIESVRAPVLGENRRLLGMIDVSRDITERKEVENRLTLAGAVFENAKEGIVVTDSRQNIIVVNPAFTEVTGYSYDEVVGRSPNLLQSGRHEPDFYRDMWTRLNEEGEWEGEMWNRKKSGEIYPEWLSIRALHDSGGRVTNFVGIFSDISQRKADEQQIWHQANYDVLTSLPNRSLFRDRMQTALTRARRHENKVALMFLDLDRFKWVNDTLGHLAGDDLLIKVARRLTGSLRENDTIARLGGDEFTVLVQDYCSDQDLTYVAQKLLDAFHEGFDIAGQDIHVSASIGIAVYPDDAQNVEQLLQCADTAMYSAKDLGRNRFSWYTDEMKQAAIKRLRLEQAMRSSIGRAEFLLHYQPVVDLRDGRCTGAEALVRWNRDGDELVMPAEFIGVAEETGFIDELGAWVMQTGLDQIGQWREAGLDFRLAVNVSGVQLRDTDWVRSIGVWLEERRGIASSFVMEFTESALIDCSKEVNEELQRLKALGVRFALDDFGTGYSSLNYLRQFSMDMVKIDRSFVQQVAERPEDARLVKALVAMAQSLNLEVIAEGIETEQQLAFLREAGCGYGQGYLFGRPMAIDDFMRHRIPFTPMAAGDV